MFLMISMLIRLMIFAVAAMATLVYWTVRAIVLLIAAAVVAVSSVAASRQRAQSSRHRRARQTLR